MAESADASLAENRIQAIAGRECRKTGHYPPLGRPKRPAKQSRRQYDRRCHHYSRQRRGEDHWIQKPHPHEGHAARAIISMRSPRTVRCCGPSNGDINDRVVGNGGPQIYKTNVGNIDRYASLSVGGPNGDTVYDGRYTIVASDADKGTITVTDNVTKETFTVWGDAHIKTSTASATSIVTPNAASLPATTNSLRSTHCCRRLIRRG
jgi:hypothetical protein